MELGSVADWVGAVGTAGALLATIVIILNDRRRRRREEAEAVIAWSSQRVSLTPGRETRHLEVSVFNGSPAPLPFVAVWSKAPGRDYIDEHLSYGQSGVEPIAPGATVRKSIPVVHHVDDSRVFLFFTERKGRRWARRLSDGKLMRAARARHLAIGASPLRATLAWSYPRKER